MTTLTPPAWLGDLLTVELGSGAPAATTYGAATYGADLYGYAIAWEAWECDVAALQIARGRQHTLERNKTGTVDLTAVDRRPHWTAAVQPAGRPIRILADGAPMFVGLVQLAELTWEGPSKVWQISGVDDLARLAQIVPDGLARPAEPLETRVNALLAIAGIPGTDYGSQSEWVQAIADSSRTLADHVGIALDSWRPSVSALADRGNVVNPYGGARPATVGARTTITTWATEPDPNGPDTVSLGCPVGVVVAWDVSDVINVASLANTGGTAVPYTDDASLSKYGRRTYQRHDLIAEPTTPPDWNISNVWIPFLGGFTDPDGHVAAVTWDVWAFPPETNGYQAGATWAQILAGVDVGHTARVNLPPDDAGLAWSATGPILGVTWDLSPRGARVTVAMFTELQDN
jgi:hypothetical protein